MDETDSPERQNHEDDAGPQDCPGCDAHFEEGGVPQTPVRLQSADDLQRLFCGYLITCFKGSNSNHEQNATAFQQVVLLPQMALTKPDGNEPGEKISRCEEATGSNAHGQRCACLHNSVGGPQCGYKECSPHPRPR